MSFVARRSFLATLGAGVAAPAILRAQGRPKRYPIAFSTLGCPAWSWKQILETADRLGYAALELRGIAGEMDLPKVLELSGSRLAETKKDLAALGCTRRTRPLARSSSTRAGGSSISPRPWA
jgi:hypothetical protein